MFEPATPQTLPLCYSAVFMMLVYLCRRAGGGGTALSHDQRWSGGLRQPLWHPLGEGHGFRQLQRAFGLYVGHHGRRRLEGKGLLLIGHFYQWIQNTTNSNKSCESPENFLFTTVLLGTDLMKCIQECNFAKYSKYNTIYFIMKCYSWTRL